MKRINKILIANRGEIACRIIQTCRKLGILTVSVYSDIDRDSIFIKMADEALCIGETGIGTYLNQDRIIDAAKKTSADAIHPGYGLLSENPEFAAHCREYGVTFIGPNPESMAVMGSKIAARELCEKIGVPVIPGFRVSNEPMDELATKALTLGYPVLIKASAGGGGIGIFLVENPSQLETVLESARKKSLAMYNNDSLLIEKYLGSVRHIEFQILGDIHGNVIHCFERECSVQRRHQKLLEEAPSPAMTEALRKSMGEAAVTIAKAVNYTNAGTIEFVLTDNGTFYFLEMNTRLQVEHPITEAITGLDLVAMQISIAEGEPLALIQDDLSIQGHAIECRIYAEDPDNDFLPSTGTLHQWIEAPGARTDSGVATSSRITIDFDPLMAKIILHADSRNHAIRKMNRALKETVAVGVATNIDFLSCLIMSDAFLNAEIKTDFFNKTTQPKEKLPLTPEESCMLITAAIIARFDDYEDGQHELTWQSTCHRMKYAGILLHGKEYSAGFRKKGKDRFEINLDKNKYDVIIAMKEPGCMRITAGGWQQTFFYAIDEDTVFLHSQNLGHHQLKLLSRFKSIDLKHLKKGTSEAPMDGKVSAIRVKQADRVNKGQDLIVIESMKMENIIQADHKGIVKEIFVQQGDFVKMGSKLIEIDMENKE